MTFFLFTFLWTKLTYSCVCTPCHGVSLRFPGPAREGVKSPLFPAAVGVILSTVSPNLYNSRSFYALLGFLSNTTIEFKPLGLSLLGAFLPGSVQEWSDIIGQGAKMLWVKMDANPEPTVQVHVLQGRMTNQVVCDHAVSRKSTPSRNL